MGRQIIRRDAVLNMYVNVLDAIRDRLGGFVRLGQEPHFSSKIQDHLVVEVLNRLDRVKVIQFQDIEAAQPERLLRLHTEFHAEPCDYRGCYDKMILKVGHRISGQHPHALGLRKPFLFAVLAYKFQVSRADGMPKAFSSLIGRWGFPLAASSASRKYHSCCKFTKIPPGLLILNKLSSAFSMFTQ